MAVCSGLAKLTWGLESASAKPSICILDMLKAYSQNGAARRQ